MQVVEPHNHRVNAAERAIQTFKDAFIAALATTDSGFPLQLWDKLAPQYKTHKTYCEERESIPTFWRMKRLMDHTIGTDTRLYRLDVKPSFMKPRRYEACGRHEVPIYGIWGCPKTITDAIYIMSRKHEHIEYRGLPSCFRSIVKSQNSVIQHI